MNEEPAAAAASAPIFHEIKAANTPQRVYQFRSITGLTYATLALVGLNTVVLPLQLLGPSDRQVAALSALLNLLILIPCYVVAAFWIYNAACNTRALGARGMQISPGWAVGWFAVPIASLFMPFQGIEETYLASGSPVGWKSFGTPLLLRAWWGTWLAAGIGGYAVAIFAQGVAGTSDVATAIVLATVVLALNIAAHLCFIAIVWRIFRAQVHSRTKVQASAEVFS
jgi:hypothetical protein